MKSDREIALDVIRSLFGGSLDVSTDVSGVDDAVEVIRQAREEWMRALLDALDWENGTIDDALSYVRTHCRVAK